MRIKTLLTTVFVAGMLLIAADYTTYAATGGSFLLGKANSANALTSLSRTTAGPALRLNTLAGSAPLFVNHTTKVGNLNADLVDNLNAAALQTRAQRYRLPAGAAGSLSYGFTGLAPGVYVASYQLQATTDGTLHCWFYTSNSPTGYTLWNASSPVGGKAFVGASGVIDTRTATVTMACNGGNITVDANDAASSQVVFTKIDGVTAGTVSSGARTSSKLVPPNRR